MKTYAPFSPISRPTFRKTTTDVVFKFFAYETNCYTEGSKKKKKNPEKHQSKWDPVSVNEMKTYIGLCVLQ